MWYTGSDVLTQCVARGNGPVGVERGHTVIHDVSTIDFYCAAFIRARGGRLLRVDKTGPSWTFAFQTKDENLLEEYASGGTCPALALAHAIGFLKRAMAAGHA
jgi:hypothetical protein